MRGSGPGCPAHSVGGHWSLDTCILLLSASPSTGRFQTSYLTSEAPSFLFLKWRRQGGPEGMLQGERSGSCQVPEMPR